MLTQQLIKKTDAIALQGSESDRPREKEVKVELERKSESSPLLQSWDQARVGNDVFLKVQKESLLHRVAHKEWDYLLNSLVGGILGCGIGAIVAIPTSIAVGLSPPGFIPMFAAIGALLPSVGSIGKLATNLLAAIDRKWFRKAKATREVSAEEIKPVLAAFDRADPYGKAFLGRWLQTWKHKIPKGNLQRNADFQISRRIHEAEQLPPAVRVSAERSLEVFDRLYGKRSTDKEVVDKHLADSMKLKALAKSLQALKEDERKVLGPRMAKRFFDPKQPRVSMNNETREALAEGIYGPDSDEALVTSLEHLAYDNKGRPQDITPGTLLELEEALKGGTPERRELVGALFFAENKPPVRLGRVRALELAEAIYGAGSEKAKSVALCFLAQPEVLDAEGLQEFESLLEQLRPEA